MAVQLNHDKIIQRIPDIESAKEVLRNSYKEWQKYFPKDTAKGLELFFNEMDTIVTLTPDEKTLLRKSIAIWGKWLPCSPDGICVHGMDITYFVESVLTTAQYTKYLSQTRLNGWLVTQASEKIWIYFRKQKGVSNEKMDSTLRAEIFDRVK